MYRAKLLYFTYNLARKSVRDRRVKNKQISLFLFQEPQLAFNARFKMSSGRIEPGGPWPPQRVHTRHSGGGWQDGASGQARLHRQVLQEGVRHAQSVQWEPSFRWRLLALPHLRLPQGQPTENPVEHQFHNQVLVIQGTLAEGGRLSTVDLLIRVARFVKKWIMFSTSRATDLN